MKFTSHSEYHPLQDVYVKPVANAYINDDKIDLEWESLNYLGRPDFNIAKEEYDAFLQVFNTAQVKTNIMPLDDTLSLDAIYCRDASITTDYGIILCNMGKEGRKLEPETHKKLFESKNIPILGAIEAPGTMEGGDVAWLDLNTLAVGHSYRTNLHGIEQLKAILHPYGIEVIVATLPHFRGPSDVFHLMSILSPVDKDLAVVYSPLMPIAFRNELLNRGFELIEVPEQEFDSLGSNVLAIAPRSCITVKGNPVTQARLRKSGCRVTTYKGNEISIKGGGGPTCLTRPLKRTL